MQNTLTLVGVLATDVESDAEDGRARFRLLITTRMWDRAESAWSSERTFVTVVCRQRLGQGVAAFLAKGDPVVVTGRLRSCAQDGRRARLEIDATCVGIDVSRISSSSAVARDAAQQNSGTMQRDGRAATDQLAV